MRDWSRRHALQAVAVAGTLALAGCSNAANRPRNQLPVQRVRITDFEAIAARNDDGEPLFVTGERPAETGNRTDGDLAARVREMHPITDEDDLGQVRFRDGSGAADLKAFVTATDLESKSVVLLQQPIRECYVPRLVGVFHEGDGVDVDVCRELRPADVECDDDAHDVFAVAVRLPFAEFDGVGSGIGDCGDQPVIPLTEEGDAT